MNQPNEKRRLEWETDRIIHSSESTQEAAAHNALAVRVNRADAEHEKRLYSVEFGRINAEGVFVRFLAPRIEQRGNYQAAVIFPNVAEYESLLAEASEHIRECIQLAFDKRLDQKREKEIADDARSKPTQQPGLKKIGKQYRQEG